MNRTGDRDHEATINVKLSLGASSARGCGFESPTWVMRFKQVNDILDLLKP
jgi:hypothetical protein